MVSHRNQDKTSKVNHNLLNTTLKQIYSFLYSDQQFASKRTQALKMPQNLFFLPVMILHVKGSGSLITRVTFYSSKVFRI